MHRRNAVLTETFWILRPVCVFLVAIAVTATAMSIKGWHTVSLLLAVMIALIGSLLVMQVHRAVSGLLRQSNVVRQAAAEAELHYVHILRRVVRFTEVREEYSNGRSERIGRLSEEMARRLNLPEETCRQLRLAGQLHDIGLLAVPEAILRKHSRLGAGELRAIRQHAEVSYEMLKPLGCLREVLPAIRLHHERMNGTGYPQGLVAEKIPIEARILAVADSYDAMTHDRPYRPAMTRLEAMRELRRCTPQGYDARCVEALEEILHLPELEKAVSAQDAPACAVAPAQ